MNPSAPDKALARWRLVLGRFAEQSLPSGSGDTAYNRMDRVLDYLYGREHTKRGARASGAGGGGSLDPSNLTVPDWLREVRDLFPVDTVEILERHALDRYGMTELVTDPEVLRKLEPNYDLLKAVLTYKDLMEGEVLELARSLVRKTIEEVRRKLEREVRIAFHGRLNRRRHTLLKSARSLDWRRTIRDNLRHYDVARKRLIAERLHFFSRADRHMPWHVIVAVDCSGSMLDSVIHSAVMAGVFAGLPAIRVSLVAFDTAVVDLTDQTSDPAALLMSVRLGGGTDIGGALGYCETLIQSPSRTILVLVTDFEEGGSPAALLGSIRRLREGQVRVLGLAALDESAHPRYDRTMAEQCAAAGAEIAALTPRRLAEWLAKIIS